MHKDVLLWTASTQKVLGKTPGRDGVAGDSYELIFWAEVPLIQYLRKIRRE